MALTRRQKWRIEKVQSEKIARANKALSKTENNKLSDEKEQQGLVDVVGTIDVVGRELEDHVDDHEQGEFIH